MSVPNFIRPGSPITHYPAGTHNWLVASVKQVLSQRGDSLELPRGEVIGPLCKNGSTAAIKHPYGIMKIEGPLNDPGQYADEVSQRVRLVGSAPKEDDGFVVLQQSAAVDQVVASAVNGLTWVKLEVIEEADEVCGVVDDETGFLETGRGSTPIVWKEAGTGKKWGIVRLGGSAAKAELIGAFAIIKGTAKGTTGIDTSGDLTAGGGKQVATIQPLTAVATSTQFLQGALLVNPSGKAVVVDGSIVVVDAINPSETDFAAGGDGIMMPGVLTDENGVRSFVISWPDFKGGPGHNRLEAQAWYHGIGKDTYELGHGECQS